MERIDNSFFERIDNSYFEDGKVIEYAKYEELIKTLVGKPVLWTDDRGYRNDKVTAIDPNNIKTLFDGQSLQNHCHIVIYKGRRYAWWNNAYVMVELLEDKCGRCSSKCRSEKGKCGLYSEE